MIPNTTKAQEKDSWMLDGLLTIRNGKDWQLTFEEWWKIWQNSGHWEERGVGLDKYQMCRYGDIGPYSKDNVYIAKQKDNLRHQFDNGKTYDINNKSFYTKCLLQ